MKIKYMLSLTALLLAISFLPAENEDLLWRDHAYSSMQKAYSGISTWQAGVTQTNYFVSAKTTLKSQGNCYYKKDNFAIHYTKPSVQAIIVAGGKVTVYDQASKTVLTSALSSSIQSLNPVEIIRSYWQKSDWRLLDSRKNVTHIMLFPKADKQIKEISFILDEVSWLITSLTYKDAQGNTVTLSFDNMKINKPIPAGVWKLNLPKDVRRLEH
jgi:outer membrane lipoprotein-sorting protein